MAGQSAGTKVLMVVVGVLGSALVAGAVLFGIQGFEGLMQRARQRAGQSEKKAEVVAKERVDRTHTVVVVAPAPLPTALPLKQRPGTDAFGYPKTYVDAAGLRSLLYYERYQELSKYFEEIQSAFEADNKKEMWTVQMADAFSSAEPELLPKLEAWARATPGSFAPYLALGSHLSARAHAERGTQFAKETPLQDFVLMHSTAKLALGHLSDALAKRPKLMAAQRARISLGLITSQHAVMNDALAGALRTCPTCYAVRVVYLYSLQPRWGGSFSEMLAFAAKTPREANPKLKLLIGYVDAEHAKIAREADNLEAALEHINTACALADHADFLEDRAELWMAKKDLVRAQQDLDLAIELRPELTSPRVTRAELYVRKREWENVASDILNVMRIDPTAHNARWAAGQAAWWLDHDGWEAHQRGDRDRAIRLLELASELVPTNGGVLNRMATAVRGNVTGTPAELLALEAKVKSAPDDFRAHQQLDYALALKRQFPRVIELWTEYLGRHPEDGRAYDERSGAYYNSGRRAEALADAEKACRLGINRACAYAQLAGQQK